MNHKEIMLNCAQVNQSYMRLPAGKVDGLETMAALYKRIANQSLQCAQAWVQDSPCPDHEPAVDAFWWGVVAWADAFGLSMGVDQTEWGNLFMYPHQEFANYLRPNGLPAPLDVVEGSPADIILTLDAMWTEKVIKLTAQWGLFHHLKDKGAMLEAISLQADLVKPGSPVRKAFLESDLLFFRHLFLPFSFTESTRKHITDWLKRAEEVHDGR